MKKIFTLLAAALMAVTASAADNLWKVTSDAAIDAETTLVDNDVLSVKNPFSTLGALPYGVTSTVNINGEEFNYGINVRLNGAPNAENPDGVNPGQNRSPLVVNIKKATTLTVYCYYYLFNNLFALTNQKDCETVTPTTAFVKAEGSTNSYYSYGHVVYDLEPGTYTLWGMQNNHYVFGLGWTSEGGDTPAPADDVIYSWSSTGPEDADVTQIGGSISYENGGDPSRLNYKNGDYYTICLNGKKANMGESPASNNAGYMKLVLDQPLKAGDKIEIYGYINKDDANAKGSAYIVFKNAAGENAAEVSETDSYPNINDVVGDQPGTHTIEVPAAADDCKEIWMTRNLSGTNVFIITLKIIDGGNKTGLDSVIAEDENAPVEYYNLQGVRIAEPAAGQIVIRRQGSKVEKLLVR